MAFIADWLALCGIGFGARTEALVLLERESTKQEFHRLLLWLGR